MYKFNCDETDRYTPRIEDLCRHEVKWEYEIKVFIFKRKIMVCSDCGKLFYN